MTSPVYFFTFYPSLIGFLVDLKTPKSPFEIKSSENCKAAIRHFSSQIKNHSVQVFPSTFFTIFLIFDPGPPHPLLENSDVIYERPLRELIKKWGCGYRS